MDINKKLTALSVIIAAVVVIGMAGLEAQDKAEA